MCFAKMKLKVGFRFRPTDEELINYFLKRELQGIVDKHKSIAVVDNFLKHEPWDLPALSAIQSNDRVWYFIYPLGKYKNSKRASRKTEAGFWSATGKVPDIWTKKGTKDKEVIGIKRTLVFYEGRVSNKSKSSKTNWVIHEYRITTDIPNPNAYVICRLEKKTVGVESSHQSSDFGNHVAEVDSLSMADAEQNIGCDELDYNSCFEMPSQLCTKQGPSNQDLSLFNGFSSDFNGVQTFTPCYPVETNGHKNLVVESDGLDWGAVGMSSAQLAQPPESLSEISYSGMSCDTNNEVAIAQGDSLSLGDLESNISCDGLDYNLLLELPPLFTTEGPVYPYLPTQFCTIESDSLDWGTTGISSAQPLESFSGISCIEDSGMSCDTNNEVAIAQGDFMSQGDLDPNIGYDELDYNLFLEPPPLFTKETPLYPYLPTQFDTIESDCLDWGAAGISSAQPLESLSGISCIEDSGMPSGTDNEVAIVQAREATSLVTATHLPTMDNSEAKMSMKSSWNGQASHNHQFFFMF